MNRTSAPASPSRGKFLLHRAVFLALLLLLAAGCGAGYETETGRGERIKEWFLPLETGKVEAYAIWPPGRGPYPALLLLHAESARAQRFRRAMFDLVREKVVLMSVSLPGFGASDGPEDFAGPRSVETAVRAAEFLAAQEEVRAGGIAVYGLGRGAIVALLAATRSPHIRLAAVQGGAYDLTKAYAELPRGKKEGLRAIVGGSPEEAPEAFRLRSPIHRLEKLGGPVLILHARRSRGFSFSQAEELAAALRKEGRPFRLQVTRRSEGDFDFRHQSIKKWVLPFMRQHLD